MVFQFGTPKALWGICRIPSRLRDTTHLGSIESYSGQTHCRAWNCVYSAWERGSPCRSGVPCRCFMFYRISKCISFIKKYNQCLIKMGHTIEHLQCARLFMTHIGYTISFNNLRSLAIFPFHGWVNWGLERLIPCPRPYSRWGTDDSV